MSNHPAVGDTITTMAELDDLPAGTIVRHEYVLGRYWRYQKDKYGRWWHTVTHTEITIIPEEGDYVTIQQLPEEEDE